MRTKPFALPLDPTSGAGNGTSRIPLGKGLPQRSLSPCPTLKAELFPMRPVAWAAQPGAGQLLVNGLQDSHVHPLVIIQTTWGRENTPQHPHPAGLKRQHRDTVGEEATTHCTVKPESDWNGIPQPRMAYGDKENVLAAFILLGGRREREENLLEVQKQK